MEKQYYDLIVSLIKKHRKFNGCEAILEDIVQDVYEHSIVVLGTVSNDDVVNSYLQKIINTSIITVPKKLNVNTRTPHRIITINPPIEKTVKVVETPIESALNLQLESDIILNDNFEEPITTETVTEELFDENVKNKDDVQLKKAQEIILQMIENEKMTAN